VTGLLDQPAITLAGAQPGQAIVLSRPIGSGVLFAAEMQKLANGNDMAALLDELERPQGTAAQILAKAGATSMTDVTGFGLAGHLFGICRESEVKAELTLDDIPLFPGALDVAIAGIRSHLYAANAASVPVVQLTGNAKDPRSSLVFDPQTAGGFLATVPASAANDVVEELRNVGNDAAVVGTIGAGSPSITLT